MENAFPSKKPGSLAPIRALTVMPWTKSKGDLLAIKGRVPKVCFNCFLSCLKYVRFMLIYVFIVLCSAFFGDLHFCLR